VHSQRCAKNRSPGTPPRSFPPPPEALEILVLLVRAHLRKWRLRQLLIDSPKRGVEKLCRRKRELITLAWRSRLPGAAPIEPFACAPRARQLFVDVIGHAGFKSAAPFVVFRDQPGDRRFDKGGFVSIEKEVYGLLLLCDGRIRTGRRRSRVRRLGVRIVFLCGDFSCLRVNAQLVHWQDHGADRATSLDHHPT
jgi:hypothetical protein